MLISSHGPSNIRQETEFAQTFAEFSASLRGEDLPFGVIQAAKANLFDTLACAIAGSNAPGVAEVRDLAVSWGALRRLRSGARNRGFRRTMPHGSMA